MSDATLTEEERDNLSWPIQQFDQGDADEETTLAAIEDWAESILTARMAEVTAEIGELRLSRAEFADEAQRLRNHLAGLSDLRGLRRAYDTACEQTESEMDRRIAAEAENARLRDTLARVEALIADGPDTWEGYDSRDTGHTFLADSVLDFTAELRAALAGGDS